MTHEFKNILGLDQGLSIHSLMEIWPLWRTRIFSYSQLEKTHRPKLKKLLSLLDEQVANEGNFDDDYS